MRAISALPRPLRLLLVAAAALNVALLVGNLLSDEAQAASEVAHDHTQLARETVCLRLAAAPGLCTHGPDTRPDGVGADPMPSVATIRRRIEARSYELRGSASSTYGSLAVSSPAVCGTAGPRVQAVYLHHPGANRYNKMLPTIRSLALVADDYVNRSAGQVGEGLRIRWATTSDCKISVRRVEVPTTARTSFNTSIARMIAAGMDAPNRKYIAWLDTSGGLCGIGTSLGDDRPGQLNANNQSTGYAQINRTCWGGGAEMHELFHTLGAVQRSAPRSTQYGHCRDEQDAMCYVDGLGTKMISPEPCAGDFEWQLDCNKNDYFHPGNPSASNYLDNHWNTAKSKWLEPDDPPPTEPVITLPDTARRLIGIVWQLSAFSKSSDGSPVTYRWKVQGYGPTGGLVSVPCSFSSTTVRQPKMWCRANGFGGPIVLTVTVTDGKGMTNATQRTISFTVPSSARLMSTTFTSNPVGITSASSTAQSVTFRATIKEQSTGTPIIGIPVSFFNKLTGTYVDRPTNTNGVATYTTTTTRRLPYSAAPYDIYGFRDGGLHKVWDGVTANHLVEWTPVFSTPSLAGTTLSGTLLPAEPAGWNYVQLYRRESSAAAWTGPIASVLTTAGGAYQFTLSGADASGVEYEVRKSAGYVNRYGTAKSDVVPIP